MKQLSRLLNSSLMAIAVGLLMATLWGWFAYRHLLAFHASQEWTYLVLCVSEALIAFFFIFRTTPKTVSNDPLDWFFAIAGTFMPLFFTPAAWGIWETAKNFILVGTVVQIIGLICLNRSLAFVAAKREIKTTGIYRYIRHPLYASYFLTFSGYVLANTTLANIFVYLMTIGCMFARLIREERHLSSDPIYIEYMRSVRFRIIPYVF